MAKSNQTKGWLENYNDSNAFASPDMVGDGLSNVGRNSSPAWGGPFKDGGLIPIAQDGYRMGTWFEEDARKRNPNMMEEQYTDYNTAMKGMMKSKIGMGNAFGHPAIKRMSQAMPKTGMTPEGVGTHYMSSMGEYAVPLLQDTGKDQLEYFENPKPSREDIKFNSPEEAEYFGEHYKEVAPMSTTYNGLQEYQMGGSIPGAVGFTYARTKGIPSEGKYAKKTLPSAQNGKEMQYYQNGLDFQPKTISKNGAWLSKYEQAQGGKKIKIKDERLEAIRPSESTLLKKPNFDLEQSKLNKTYIRQASEQKQEDARRKKLTKAQREREDYNARNEQTGSIQTPVEESTWDRAKAIVSNPLTAFGYAARNESLPTRFQHGERNTLDNAIDWINPLQGAAALSEIPGELGRGEYLNAGLSALDAADLGVYAKGAMKASKPLLQKAGKALGTEEGLLSNAYKYNPWAFKSNESNWYRQVGKSAVDDAFDTGLIREAGEEVSPRMWGEFQDQIKRLQGDDALSSFEKMKQQMLASRRPISPFFNKGELFYPMNRKPVVNKKTGKLSKNPAGAGSADYLIETSLPNESFQPAYVKGMYLGVPEEIGSTAILKPNPELRNLENFNIYKKNWLQGYKKIPKQEDGGVIKDDRGQWAYPRKITEIGSNQITMQGVPYDVLGISDEGDVKLMKPGKDYKFKGKKVTEFPLAKNGVRQEQKGLQNLEDLTNFTNYNKPTNWLNKYN